MAIEPSNLFGASMLDAIKATKEILEKRYKDRGNKDYCMKAHNLDSTLAKLDYVDVSTIFEADLIERIMHSVSSHKNLPPLTPYPYLLTSVDNEHTDKERHGEDTERPNYREFITSAHVGKQAHSTTTKDRSESVV